MSASFGHRPACCRHLWCTSTPALATGSVKYLASSSVSCTRHLLIAWSMCPRICPRCASLPLTSGRRPPAPYARTVLTTASLTQFAHFGSLTCWPRVRNRGPGRARRQRPRGSSRAAWRGSARLRTLLLARPQPHAPMSAAFSRLAASFLHHQNKPLSSSNRQLHSGSVSLTVGRLVADSPGTASARLARISATTWTSTQRPLHQPRHITEQVSEQEPRQDPTRRHSASKGRSLSRVRFDRGSRSSQARSSLARVESHRMRASRTSSFLVMRHASLCSCAARPPRDYSAPRQPSRRLDSSALLRGQPMLDGSRATILPLVLSWLDEQCSYHLIVPDRSPIYSATLRSCSMWRAAATPSHAPQRARMPHAVLWGGHLCSSAGWAWMWLWRWSCRGLACQL